MPGEYANLNISKLNEDDLEELNVVMVAMEEAAAGIHKEADVKNNVKRALEEHGTEKVMQAVEDFFEQHLSDQLIFRRADGTVAGKCEFITGLGGGSNKRTVDEVRRLSGDDRQDCSMITLIVFTKENSTSGVEIERR